MHEHKLCNEQIRSHSDSTASNQESFWGFSMAASSSTAATLSWSSSSFFQTFGNTVNESVKLPDKRSVLLVLAQKKAKKTRKIILKEDVAELGKKGQLLDVKGGFYRNYLHPMGKAQIVTPLLLKEMKMEEERIEAEKKRVKEEAQSILTIPALENLKMAFRIHLFSPKTLLQSQNFQTYPKRPKTQILCASNNKKRSDAELALDLATEVGKINTHLAQKEEAMKKSKELLFTEFCQYLALERDEVKKEWRKIDEDEKWGLVKRFVNEWSDNFHPLSARSVKEMLEEHLLDERQSSSSGFVLFPGLKKIMGFSHD